MSTATESIIIQTIKDHNKGLQNFIRSRVDNAEDAEDILQEVWYQLSIVINAAPIEQITAWLYKVARNKIIDKYRKKTELPFSTFLMDDEEEEINYKEIFLKESVTPEIEYVKNLFWQELHKALNELPLEQKQVFIWHELEDISFQDIAAVTNEKVNTLISRKHYVIIFLRKRLNQLYQEIIKY